MRKTSKTIEFDFAFTYSKGGQYTEATSVTVCEPNFDNRDVFTKMGRWAIEAQTGLFKLFGDKKREEIEDAVEAEAPKQDDVNEDDGLMTMRLGLTNAGYSDFVKYVEKTLTGNKMLAYIGTPDDRVPLTEETWRNIAEQGGLAEMERIHSVFTSFFTATPQGREGSKKTTGTEQQSGRAGGRKGLSNTTKH